MSTGRFLSIGFPVTSPEQLLRSTIDEFARVIDDAKIVKRVIATHFPIIVDRPRINHRVTIDKTASYAFYQAIVHNRAFIQHLTIGGSAHPTMDIVV